MTEDLMRDLRASLAGSGVRTPDTVLGVPNKPKTTIRGFRIDDDLYRDAQLAAEFNGEPSLTDVVKSKLADYAKRTQKKPGYGEWLAAREQADDE